VEAPKAEVPKAAPAPPRLPSAPAKVEGRISRKRMSPLRRKIADSLVNARRTAAILTTFNECDMSQGRGSSLQSCRIASWPSTA